MLALIEIPMNAVLLAAIILASASFGFLLTRSQIRKQKSTIAKLEVEMLHSHSEILQLQKELSDKENLQSRTPIFSIKDTAVESSQEQLPGGRISKKAVGGNGKSTS